MESSGVVRADQPSCVPVSPLGAEGDDANSGDGRAAWRSVVWRWVLVDRGARDIKPPSLRIPHLVWGHPCGRAVRRRDGRQRVGALANAVAPAPAADASKRNLIGTS